MAGALMTRAARERGVRLLPVDSEHSALFQCLAGAAPREVRRLVLTASGGPFRGWSRGQARRGHGRAGAPPPDLADGREDHHRLGHAHEQGPRGPGGPLAVRRSVRADRGRRASAVDRPFDGRVRRPLGPRTAGHAGHGHSDPLRADVPGAAAVPAPALDLVGLGSLTSRRPTRRRSPAWGWPDRRAGPGAAAPLVLNAANEVAVAAFLAGRLRASWRCPG